MSSCSQNLGSMDTDMDLGKVSDIDTGHDICEKNDNTNTARTQNILDAGRRRN